MKKIFVCLTVLLSLCVFLDVYSAAYQNNLAVPLNVKNTGGRFSANPIIYNNKTRHFVPVNAVSHNGGATTAIVYSEGAFNNKPVSGGAMPVVGNSGNATYSRNSKNNGPAAQYSNVTFPKLQLKSRTASRMSPAVREAFSLNAASSVRLAAPPGMYDQWYDLFVAEIGREPLNDEELQNFINLKLNEGENIFSPTPVGNIPWLMMIILLAGYVIVRTKNKEQRTKIITKL